MKIFLFFLMFFVLFGEEDFFPHKMLNNYIEIEINDSYDENQLKICWLLIPDFIHKGEDGYCTEPEKSLKSKEEKEHVREGKSEWFKPSILKDKKIIEKYFSLTRKTVFSENKIEIKKKIVLWDWQRNLKEHPALYKQYITNAPVYNFGENAKSIKIADFFVSYNFNSYVLPKEITFCVKKMRTEIIFEYLFRRYLDATSVKPG